MVEPDFKDNASDTTGERRREEETSLLAAVQGIAELNELLELRLSQVQSQNQILEVVLQKRETNLL